MTANSCCRRGTIIVSKHRPTKRQIAEKQGQRGEWIACWWLRLRGYRLIARRWRSPFGEIDLIMRKGAMLIFVEVKWRQAIFDTSTVSPHQQRRILNATTLFISKHPTFSRNNYRIDIIVIRPSAGFLGMSIHHIPNALSNIGINLDR